MKKEPFLPNHYYLIQNSSNNFETLFVERRNYSYFLMLCERHIGKIASIYAFRFLDHSFELLFRIHDFKDLPARYQNRLHQPFANLFQAYCKGFNKTYGRSGSVFREHFKRVRVDENQALQLKKAMERTPFTSKNRIP